MLSQRFAMVLSRTGGVIAEENAGDEGCAQRKSNELVFRLCVHVEVARQGEWISLFLSKYEQEDQGWRNGLASQSRR